jgi:WD40 repeat protein
MSNHKRLVGRGWPKLVGQPEACSSAERKSTGRCQPCFQLGALLALISCSFALDIATAEDQLPGEKALSGGLFSLPLLKVSSEESTQNERVTSIAFSPDGKTVLSGSHDKSIAVWDADAVLLDAKEGAHS